MTLRTVYDGDGVTTTDTIISSSLTRNTDFEIDVLEVELYKEFTIVQGDELEYIDEDSNTIFKGIVKIIMPGQSTKIVKVYSYEQELNEDIVENVFTSVSPEGLIQTMISTYSSLTYSSTISTGITIDEYNSNNKTPWEIISDIIERMPGVTYYVSPDKVFTLFEKGSVTTPITLTNFDNCIIEEEWNQDISNQTTRLLLVGNKQVTPKTELFSGTGSQTEFSLDEFPIDMKVSVGGTEQTLQRENTASGDYTYSKDQKKIIFNSAPPSGTNNIEVVYNFELNLKIEMDADPAVIASYGVIENKVTKKFLNTYDELIDYATEYLAIYGTPLNSNSAFLTQTFNMQNLIPGYQIRVFDDLNQIDGADVDRFFLINSVTRNMPEEGITIDVGDRRIGVIDFFKELKTNLDQIKEEDDNATITMKSQLLTNNVAIKFDLDVISIEKRSFPSDTLYWQEGKSNARTKWRVGGTGSVWRTASYTSTDVDGLETERVLEDASTLRLTEGGTTRVLEGTAGTIVTNGVITSTYMVAVRDNFLSQLNTLITHRAIGDDNTAPIVSNTTLGNETYREALFSSNVSGDTYSVVLRLDTSENNGNTMAEVGSFDDASAGNMYTHNLVTSESKTNLKEATYITKVITSTTNEDLN